MKVVDILFFLKYPGVFSRLRFVIFIIDLVLFNRIDKKQAQYLDPFIEQLVLLYL